MPAELPLVPSAIALAAGGLVIFLPERVRFARGLGMVMCLLGSVLPVALDPLVDPTRAAGRALWEWSAIGGPAVQASYDVDPLAVIALALTVAFTAAALATAQQMQRRHPALAGLILAVGLVTMALVVTDDLVAATVVLAVVAALTVLALLAVAPAAATARAAGYLAVGLQAWVLSALLISTYGAGGYLLGDLPRGAITPSVLLAATIGGLLFSGLYPVVAWSIEKSRDAGDPGPLGSLVLMPAGIGATLLVLRLLGRSGLPAGTIALPEVAPEVRLAAIVIVLLALAVTVGTSRRVPARWIVVGAVVTILIAALPLVGWSQLVLAAAVLTAAYAGAVSLAMADQWETVRADLGLVVLWIGIATGSPLGVAGGLVALAARAASAIASSSWHAPHREHVALVGGSAIFVAGAIAAGEGALAAPDAATRILGVVATVAVVAVELAHLARRSPPNEVPLGLAVVSAIVAILLATFATMVAVPITDVVGSVVPTRQPLDAIGVSAVADIAAAAVILARTARPLLPLLERVAARSGPAMRALDPVPIGVGAFGALGAVAERASAAFGLFEQRAGVWLATLLIVALLVWAVR
ncbi:MAG: hypothetical protein KGJ98_11495 [Chloroflexota bacterium]|nr:hypothetical protein [Chloroflexota bacterium]MDE3102848.1 hypothetical protein [Chloroflexota bacterium]